TPAARSWSAASSPPWCGVRPALLASSIAHCALERKGHDSPARELLQFRPYEKIRGLPGPLSYNTLAGEYAPYVRRGRACGAPFDGLFAMFYAPRRPVQAAHLLELHFKPLGIRILRHLPILSCGTMYARCTTLDYTPGSPYLVHRPYDGRTIHAHNVYTHTREPWQVKRARVGRFGCSTPKKS